MASWCLAGSTMLVLGQWQVVPQGGVGTRGARALGGISRRWSSTQPPSLLLSGGIRLPVWAPISSASPLNNCRSFNDVGAQCQVTKTVVASGTPVGQGVCRLHTSGHHSAGQTSAMSTTETQSWRQGVQKKQSDKGKGQGGKVVRHTTGAWQAPATMEVGQEDRALAQAQAW